MKNRSVQILLFSRYDTLGASSRLRTYQYLPALEQQGIEVTRRPLFDNAYLTALYAGVGLLPADWRSIQDQAI